MLIFTERCEGVALICVLRSISGNGVNESREKQNDEKSFKKSDRIWNQHNKHPIGYKRIFTQRQKSDRIWNQHNKHPIGYKRIFTQRPKSDRIYILPTPKSDRIGLPETQKHTFSSIFSNQTSLSHYFPQEHHKPIKFFSKSTPQSADSTSKNLQITSKTISHHPSVLITPQNPTNPNFDSHISKPLPQLQNFVFPFLNKSMATRGQKGGRSKGRAQLRHQVDPIPEFSNVEFATIEQRERFVKLHEAHHMSPTRFLCTQTMRTLGLHAMMERLFINTGIGSIYGMYEHSYADLTLEFISSFVIDKDDSYISFRLCNRNYRFSSSNFGSLFRFRFDNVSADSDKFPYEDLWPSLSGAPLIDFSKLRTNDIPHPGLRLWFRTVIGTIFGRREKGTINKTELFFLGHHLNFRRVAPYGVNISGCMANHFARVAQGKIRNIEIGGLVTFLAKELGVFDADDHTPLSELPPLIDLPYLMSTHRWLKRERGVYQWKADRTHWITLPSEILPSLDPLPEAEPDEVLPFPSYLIDFGHQAPALAHAPTHSEDDEFPPGFTAPSPTRGYTGPTRDQFIRQSVNMNLHIYGQHHKLVRKGQVPPEGPHPSFYRGPDGAYGGYPGAVFDEFGIDPSTWGHDYGRSYGDLGAGGSGAPDQDGDADEADD